MQRRDALFGLAVISIPGLLAACGGGAVPPTPSGTSDPEITQFSSDKASYFIGEPATFSAAFTKGSATLLPYGTAIQNNVPVTLPRLTSSTVTLQVQSGATVTRALQLQLKYRDQWQLIDMGTGRSMHVTALSGNTLYVLGGSNLDGIFPDTVLLFDALTERFSAGGKLLSGRTGHTATMLKNGTGILVTGGLRSNSGTPIAEYYDCVAAKSRATAGQPRANRIDHSATLLADGKVLLVGGQASGETFASNSADLYDPATDLYTRLPSGLKFGRASHHATLLKDGKVLISGGGRNPNEVLPFELYDPGSQTFSTLQMPGDTIARIENIIVRLDNGDVLMLGGVDFSGTRPANSVVKFTAGTSSTAVAGTLGTQRAAPSGVQLLDGRILVTGGYDDEKLQPLASVELYSPQSNNSTAGPAMFSVRMNHTTDLLPTGKAIVIGGDTGGIGVSSTAELYS